jgi:hypothetical protein
LYKYAQNSAKLTTRKMDKHLFLKGQQGHHPVGEGEVVDAAGDKAR